MARYERFTFLCNKQERKLIEALAHRLQRSQSDTMRFLVRHAANDFLNQPIQRTEINTYLGVEDGQQS